MLITFKKYRGSLRGRRPCPLCHRAAPPRTHGLWCRARPPQGPPLGPAVPRHWSRGSPGSVLGLDCQAVLLLKPRHGPPSRPRCPSVAPMSGGCLCRLSHCRGASTGRARKVFSNTESRATLVSFFVLKNNFHTSIFILTCSGFIVIFEEVTRTENRSSLGCKCARAQLGPGTEKSENLRFTAD